jgi:hypothetical protein
MRKTAPSSTSSKVRTLFQLASVQHMLMLASLGAQGCLSVVPETASIANRVFASFLAGLPSAHSRPPPPTAPLDEALQRLAEIMHDPDIGNREPSSPMSFSCVPPVVAYRRLEIYARAAPGHRGAFSPLDMNGRPKRRCVSDPISSSQCKNNAFFFFFFFFFFFCDFFRYSDRIQEQWFEVDRNGMSWSGANRIRAVPPPRASRVLICRFSDRAIGGRTDA